MRQYKSPTFLTAAASVAQDILDANTGFWGIHKGLPGGKGNVERAGVRLAKRVKDVSDCACRIDLLMDRFNLTDGLRAAPREVRNLVRGAWQALSEASLIMADIHYDEEGELWYALPLAERVERLRTHGRALLRAEWLGQADALWEARERFLDRLSRDTEAASAIGVDRFAPDQMQDFARAIAFAMPAVRVA